MQRVVLRGYIQKVHILLAASSSALVAKAIGSVLTSLTRVEGLEVAAEHRLVRDCLYFFDLPPIFLAAMIPVLSKYNYPVILPSFTESSANPHFRTLTLVNWEFISADHIPRVPRLAELQLFCCRLRSSLGQNLSVAAASSSLGLFSNINMQLGLLALNSCSGLLEIQRWIANSTTTSTVTISGVSELDNLRPELLQRVQRLELDLTDGISLLNLNRPKLTMA